MITLTSNIVQAAAQPRGLPEVPHQAVAPARGRQEVAAPGNTADAGPEPTPAVRQPDGSSVAAAVLKLNEYLQQEQRTLQFSIDEESGNIVIRVTDAKTDQVIRQIPSEEVLAIMRHLSDGETRHQGVLVRETV